MNSSLFTRNLCEIRAVRVVLAMVYSILAIVFLFLAITEHISEARVRAFLHDVGQGFCQWIELFVLLALGLCCATSFVYGLLADQHTMLGLRGLLRWYWVECLLAALAALAICLAKNHGF
ncbi:MAG: hypothetical protein NT154_01610 [Verrucomicrobia bacterium]|nr:hypothetical protein [Verrucomicrobiota bacterium]